ncbi:ABC transporter permease [bacterium]|nr:ABC transporter permease [bacterium]RQV93272.1 MAG: ABC transporter permease [bacterium]
MMRWWKQFQQRIFRSVHSIGEVAYLWFDTLRYGFKRPYEFKSLLHQMEEIGVRSLPIVLISSFFVGMVMAIQVAYSEANFAGRVMVGIGVGVAITREFGPLLTALLVGGRISAGMTSVIGSMRVTEQVDAIRLLGASPAKKLVFPRIFAALLMLPLLTAVADFVGVFGGLVVSLVDIKMTFMTYIYQVQRAVSLTDFFGGIFKAVIFGFFIALIGCYNGLKVEGGAEGVGKATTRSVVASSVCVMISDYFLTKLLIIL